MKTHSHFTAFILLMDSRLSSQAAPLRIMPVGDSITAGDTGIWYSVNWDREISGI